MMLLLTEEQLSGDSELSVKNGAELLDRLVKDIVSESAAHYVSILNFEDKVEEKANNERRTSGESSREYPPAFSLAKFIPLLEERIHVLNPFTRTFLVSWLSLLDTIPDLELVHYLPSFLGGLLKFLGDQNRDVYVATQGLLERLLAEIVKIANIRKGIAESRRSRLSANRRDSGSQVPTSSPGGSATNDNAVEDSISQSDEDGYDDASGDWIPGQDVEIDYAAILDILLKFVDPSSPRESASTLRLEGLSKQKEEEIGIVALRWIATFFEVAPDDILAFVPRLLGQVLPALASQSDQFQAQAATVNRALMEYVVSYQDEGDSERFVPPTSAKEVQTPMKTAAEGDASLSIPQLMPSDTKPEAGSSEPGKATSVQSKLELDYTEAVRVLQLQLLHEREETRVTAITWLRLMHRKAPDKVLALHDGTFPVLLKTLSDAAEAVVIQDLQLLSQLSKNSEDDYFQAFMVALLQLFSTDRKLLEIRGNLIIRQLCINLRPERIYRTFADCIERDEDIEFSSIMVQNLNNNLITAPELAELRKRLRNLDTKDGQAFFVALFKAWSYNAVATFSLCLLAQQYEQAYSLLQIFADLEMTVNMLIQIDKLVQLLESPVFTYLRIQLLEPEKYPYLYKCLYGLLMLLPQSSAFAALKNRLNSVNAIALLHTPLAMPTSARTSIAAGSGISGSTPSTSTIGIGASRLNRRDPGTINTTGEVKWNELLDKFRNTQDKARRRHERLLRGDDSDFEDRHSRRERIGVDAYQETTRSAPGQNVSAGGRVSRQSLEIGRPGSGLSMNAERAVPSAGLGLRPTTGSYSGTAIGANTGPNSSRPGFSYNAGQNNAGSLEKDKHAHHSHHGHKSKHSLMGKFTSGIGRTVSKDKDKGGK